MLIGYTESGLRTPPIHHPTEADPQLGLALTLALILQIVLSYTIQYILSKCTNLVDYTSGIAYYVWELRDPRRPRDVTRAPPT